MIGTDKLLETIRRYHNQDWIAGHHVQELKSIAKKLLFVVQGDKNAPVTRDNLQKKEVEYIEMASESENIWFWSPDQLSINQANNLNRVIFTSFYSTGKTKLMIKRAEMLAEKGENVAFIIANHVIKTGIKLALTLQMEEIFKNQPNIKVYEIR